MSTPNGESHFVYFQRPMCAEAADSVTVYSNNVAKIFSHLSFHTFIISSPNKHLKTQGQLKLIIAKTKM